jgi:hypothetical protein
MERQSIEIYTSQNFHQMDKSSDNNNNSSEENDTQTLVQFQQSSHNVTQKQIQIIKHEEEEVK